MSRSDIEHCLGLNHAQWLSANQVYLKLHLAGHIHPNLKGIQKNLTRLVHGGLAERRLRNRNICKPCNPTYEYRLMEEK
jgi:hypothetical protein